jgi:glycosyltransferase involved in cell wall biosynthesis
MVVYTDYVFDARVRREAETLAANGFHVRCLALTTKSTPASGTFVLDGVEVHAVPVKKYRGKSQAAYLLSYIRFLLASSVVCLRLLIKRQLDVVHVHNLPDFLVLAGFLPRLAGCKVVLDVHDSVPETFATKFSGRSLLWRLLCLEERVSALVAHRVICVNHPQRDTLIERGIAASKTFVSMNVPDPRIFRPAATGDEVGNGSGHINLVYHGTMAARLGVDLVIRAVARLAERLPCVRLHLWGHGDDLASFQQLARELDIQDKVLFRPQGFPLQELPEQLEAMDIGVVGNRRTIAGDLMLPVKLLEYVALDIPAIVPRLKTIEYYFADEMVSYFDAEDVESLAEALYRLCSQPQIGRTQAVHARRFLDEYGWDRQGRELVNFYGELLENRKSGDVNV